MKLQLISFFLISSSLFAQKFDELNQYFDSIQKFNSASGSVEITKNNTIVYSRNFGLLDAEKNIPNDNNSKYRIGSISKMFTASLILKAVDEKKLSLNTKLSKFYPEYKNGSKITIHHLLNHTSGIFNFTNDSLFWISNNEHLTKEKMLDKIMAYDIQFKAGEKNTYSNSAYFILALILEQIYQTDYNQILQDKIAIPLNLSNTYEGTEISSENNEASSIYYSFNTNNWINNSITHNSQLLGAGGIISTPHDLNVFNYSLLTGSVISAKSLELMKKMTFDYGYGIYKIPYGIRLGYGHNGGVDSYSSITAYFPRDSVSISITLNGYYILINDILQASLSAEFNNPIKFPTPVKSIKVESDKLKQYEGIYHNKLYKLKLVVKVDSIENSLSIKIDNQPSIITIPTALHSFSVPMVDARFLFQPQNNKLYLYQFGNKIEFLKE